jgi:hypothetical protein
MIAPNQTRPVSARMRWLASLCLLLFVVAGIAEAAHFHPDAGKGPDEQHCSLCIAAHSIARPAQIAGPVPSPTRCVGVLTVSTPVVPDSRSILSLSIRPPPAA